MEQSDDCEFISVEPNGYVRIDLGLSLVYNPHAVTDPRILPGFFEAPSIVRRIISDYLCSKKIIGSKAVAMKIIAETPRYSRKSDGTPITITEENIIEAYAIACGGGTEYEWPYP